MPTTYLNGITVVNDHSSIFHRYCGRRYCWVDSNSDWITYYHSDIQKEVFIYSITLSLIVREKF